MGNKFHRLNLNTVKEKLSGLKVYTQKVQDFFISLYNKVIAKGFTKKQTAIICGLLIACLIIVLIPTKQIETPEATISQIETAIVNADTKTVSKLVNIDNIATQISKALVAEVESKKVTADLLSYMQQELENKIISDFLNIIHEKGNFYQNLNNPNAVLSKMLNFLMGETGTVTTKSIKEISETTSVIEVNIFRPDFEREIKIDLNFIHNDFNWVLDSISNVPELLNEIENIETQRIAKFNSSIQDQIAQVIVLKDFQKSNIDLKDNSFLIRLSLENISKFDVIGLKGKLKVMNKDQVIGLIDINIEDTIFANNFYEKAWGIKLTDYESLKNIIKTNSANFNAIFEIQEIVFADGKTLKIIQ